MTVVCVALLSLRGPPCSSAKMEKIPTLCSRVLLRRNLWSVNQPPIFQYVSKTLQEVQRGQTAAGKPVMVVVDTKKMNALSQCPVGQNESPLTNNRICILLALIQVWLNFLDSRKYFLDEETRDEFCSFCPYIFVWGLCTRCD